MHPAFLGLAVLLVLAVHAWALYAGNDCRTWLQKLATISGKAGLLSIGGLALAYLDAFSQIWVKRAGYEGGPVFFFLYAVGVVTLVSAFAAMGISIEKRRDAQS